MKNNIDLKKMKTEIIMGFIKRIIRNSSLLLEEKSDFSDNIIYQRDLFFEDRYHNNPISGKQGEVELLVKGIFISYINAVSKNCDFIYNHEYFDSKYKATIERIEYDMHELFKENCFKTSFIVVNERYHNLVENELIIPSFANISCYDVELDYHYEIAPYIENNTNYKKNLSNSYKKIDDYFQYEIHEFDSDNFLEEKSEYIFKKSYEGLLKDLSKKEIYCAVFIDVIESGLFDDVFKFLQEERSSLIDFLSEKDNNINTLFYNRIYSYLEKKEISDKFDKKFTDIKPNIEDEEENKIKFKKRRL